MEQQKNKWGRPRTHGMSQKNRFYKIYDGILSRCNNEKATGYYRYWARGIRCEWESFEDFRVDMYESYLDHVARYGEKNTSIDRIDNEGNYCKDNCRWATTKEQSRHKCSTMNIEYDSKRFTSLKDLSEYTWVEYELLKSRLLRWWELSRAIEKPKGKRRGKDFIKL